jgi:sugar phosphate isomerase/epimerase
VNIKAFVQALKKVGYRGPLCIEREVGDQEERLRDVAHGIGVLREALAG